MNIYVEWECNLGGKFEKMPIQGIENDVLALKVSIFCQPFGKTNGLWEA
jgi:hypothetical protein